MFQNKIIKIKGGLGNQFFQYAHGRKLELIDKKNIIFDTSFFVTKSRDIERPFLLNKFNINATSTFKVTPQNLYTKIYEKILIRLVQDYSFYQNEKYFKEIQETIYKELSLKEQFSGTAQEMENRIRECTSSVSVHIRRGDYISSPTASHYHGTYCDLDYYAHAMQHLESIVENPTYFIFSDDIEWVKQNMKVDTAVYVSRPEIADYEELVLMSLCSHNIIANSSFSWWAGYLNRNPEKIVIGPKQWTNHKTSDQLGILPKSWIQI